MTKRNPAQKLARKIQAETGKPYTACLAEARKRLTDTPVCTATIEGPHTGSSKPIPCALPAHGDDQQHESAPEGPTRRRLHWTDHHVGATPHRAPREESTP